MSEITTSPQLAEEEITLEPREAEALRSGLNHLPVPRPGEGFNERTLVQLAFSGRELDSWTVQAARRIKWMLFPAVLSFVMTLALALWQTRALPPLPLLAPKVNNARPAPPLPPLPTHLYKPQRAPQKTPSATMGGQQPQAGGAQNAGAAGTLRPTLGGPQPTMHLNIQDWKF